MPCSCCSRLPSVEASIERPKHGTSGADGRQSGNVRFSTETSAASREIETGDAREMCDLGRRLAVSSTRALVPTAATAPRGFSRAVRRSEASC